jgi:hypothetical protein
MSAVNKHFDAGARRAAIELWRVKVPQRAIMKQLGMSKATLTRVLAFARANPADPIAKQKKGSGHPTKLAEATLEIMKTKLQDWDEDDRKQVMFSDESQENGGVEERDH